MTKKSAKSSEPLGVWLDDPAFGPLQRLGLLAQGGRGTWRFSYDPAWLKSKAAFALDPQLQLSDGDHFPLGLNFGIFLDSCPDRWGQVLMRRREAAEAEAQGRRARDLDPWDFLTGVQDLTRMGALRFMDEGSGLFVAAEAASVPPLARLAELQAIAFELSRKDAGDLPKLRQWLQVLVAPGSSLGGARPKANLLGEDGSLWIAKFPAADDVHDVGLWEKLLHDLAKDAGVQVPPAKTWALPGGQHSFLVQRFDRSGNQRHFFASAMTLLGRQDGQSGSYLELAELIASQGAPDRIAADLEQLFRRVVFNVLVANRDDHLRNHGFLRHPQGWVLAPAYDMNVAFGKKEHSLALDERQPLPDLGIVLATAPYYRLSGRQAQTVVDSVVAVVKNWQQKGRELGLSRGDLKMAEGLITLN